MSECLVLLTNRATSYKMGNKGRKTWPPEILFKERLSAKMTQVASKGRRMNRMEERRARSGWNIYVIFKKEMATIEGPVKEKRIRE